MSFEFNPTNNSSFGFRSVFGDVSMGERLIRQSWGDSAGLHTSSDSTPHWDIRNSSGQITGHLYQDGSVNDFNDSLGWL
jgi:hypothetical protein